MTTRCHTQVLQDRLSASRSLALLTQAMESEASGTTATKSPPSAEDSWWPRGVTNTLYSKKQVILRNTSPHQGLVKNDAEKTRKNRTFLTSRPQLRECNFATITSRPVAANPHPSFKYSHPNFEAFHPNSKSSHPNFRSSYPKFKLSPPKFKSSYPNFKYSHPKF